MRYIYIGFATDEVRIMLTILMSHTESYSRVSVIRVNSTWDVGIVGV